MRFLVRPSTVSGGTVRVPGDKSISHRAVMFGAIADGPTAVSGFLDSEDCRATVEALRALGVTIDKTDSQMTIHGVGLHGLVEPSDVVDLGNSGTAIRLMSGLLAGQSFDTTLTGDASLRSRPMSRVIDPLTQMGAVIESEEGRAPLTIHGDAELSGIDYTLPVASAQVKSAVLLAGLYAAGMTTVKEPAVTRDHTERMLEAMGARIECADGRCRITGENALTGTTLEVPGDLSSAAFLMVATLIADDAELRIERVGVNPTRTGVIDILRAMGGSIEIENPDFAGGEPVADLIVRSSELKAISVEPELVSLAIDEFPILFVAAAAAKGLTRFSGLAELRVKESDRIATMCEGLKALGIDITEFEDGAVVQGGALRGGTVDSAGDHRIAMAFAVAGSVADGPVDIDDVANVATSFPGFTALMRSIGLDIASDTESAAVPVIAIDGPSGSGKGTIARQVADALGYHLLDSGALYRLVALAANQRGVPLDDVAGLAEIAAALDCRFGSTASGEEQIFLGGVDVTGEIRTEEAGAGASAVAQIQAVREALLGRQRAFREGPGLVADGRDMGTQVFTDAEVKVFLTASPEERAKRRHKQLKDKGIDVSLAALSRDIEDRDRRDSERSVAPLKPAEDARILDSSGLTIDEVVNAVLDWVAES